MGIWQQPSSSCLARGYWPRQQGRRSSDGNEHLPLAWVDARSTRNCRRPTADRRPLLRQAPPLATPATRARHRPTPLALLDATRRYACGAPMVRKSKPQDAQSSLPVLTRLPQRGHLRLFRRRTTKTTNATSSSRITAKITSCAIMLPEPGSKYASTFPPVFAGATLNQSPEALLGLSRQRYNATLSRMRDKTPEPNDAFGSYLASYLDAEYREKVGPLGLLRLSDPTRVALRAYEEELVAAARIQGATWQEIGDALRVPRQTAHRRYSHLPGPRKAKS